MGPDVLKNNQENLRDFSSLILNEAGFQPNYYVSRKKQN